MHHTVMFVSLGWLTCLAAGCSGGGPDYAHATISGTVTVNGDRIEKGVLTYHPSTSGTGRSDSADIVDGKYHIAVIGLGKHSFTFSAWARTGKTIPGPDGNPEPERVNIIPKQLRSTGILREITESGIQDFDIKK